MLPPHTVSIIAPCVEQPVFCPAAAAASGGRSPPDISHTPSVKCQSVSAPEPHRGGMSRN